MRALAYVFSPEHEHRFASLELTEALRPHMAIELFEDLNLALEWLEQQRQNDKTKNITQSHAA